MTEKPLLERRQRFFRPAVPLPIAVAAVLDFPLDKTAIKVTKTFVEQEAEQEAGSLKQVTP